MKIDFKSYNLFDDSLYFVDPENYELLWINNHAKKEFGSSKKGQKCYEYFFGREAPCVNCQINTLLSNPKKYLNNSIIRKLDYPINDKEYMVKEKLFKDNNKLYKLSIIFGAQKIIKSTSKIKQIKIMYENLLDTISDISLECNNETTIKRLLAGLQDMFKGTRCVFVENQAIFYEENEQTSFQYTFDNELIQAIENNTEYLRLLRENNYLNLCTSKIRNSIIKEQLEKRGIKTIIYMNWHVPFGTYSLIIENSSIKRYNSQVFKTIKSIINFMLRTIQYNEMLFKMSNIDALTGCYNRTYFNTILSKYSQEIYQNVGVLFLDLDELKTINDQFGHRIGDQNIVAVARLIRKIFFQEEIFKIGGDEFVIIINNQSFEVFNQKTDHLRKELELSKLACSIGVCYRSDNVLIEEMIDEAEKEMYVQKRHHHSSNISENQNTRLSSSIYVDIEERHFICALQPKIDPYTNKIIGVEALARGIRSNGDIVYPNEFIPILEKNNYIDILDYYMIEEVCRLLKKYRKSYKMDLPISVNISRQTIFIPSFCDDIVRIYDKYQIPRDKLALEITEKMEVSADGLLEICAKLRNKGFVLEIDDFGSYFTNLVFLNENIFSTIKLDKSLVRKMSKESLTKEVVSYIIQKCHDKGISVIFEGVETAENVELAKEMKADAVQGFYYDKPLFENEFIKKYLSNSRDVK